jgi:hypothetical protein
LRLQHHGILTIVFPPVPKIRPTRSEDGEVTEHDRKSARGVELTEADRIFPQPRWSGPVSPDLNRGDVCVIHDNR